MYWLSIFVLFSTELERFECQYTNPFTVEVPETKESDSKIPMRPTTETIESLSLQIKNLEGKVETNHQNVMEMLEEFSIGSSPDEIRIQVETQLKKELAEFAQKLSELRKEITTTIETQLESKVEQLLGMKEDAVTTIETKMMTKLEKEVNDKLHELHNNVDMSIEVKLERQIQDLLIEIVPKWQKDVQKNIETIMMTKLETELNDKLHELQTGVNAKLDTVIEIKLEGALLEQIPKLQDSVQKTIQTNMVTTVEKETNEKLSDLKNRFETVIETTVNTKLEEAQQEIAQQLQTILETKFEEVILVHLPVFQENVETKITTIFEKKLKDKLSALRKHIDTIKTQIGAKGKTDLRKQLSNLQNNIRTKLNRELHKRFSKLQKDIVSKAAKFNKDVEKCTKSVKQKENKKSQEATGFLTYTHWGKDKCTGMNVKTIYSGFTGGSCSYDNGYGAPRKLCLSNEAQWGKRYNLVNDNSDSGAIYIRNSDLDIEIHLNGKNTQYRLKCAACLKSGSVTVMVPGREDCYEGWTKEYSGLLFVGYPTHTVASGHICVDHNPSVFKKRTSWNYKSLLYSILIKWKGNNSCPPYSLDETIVCVVCSK